MERPSPACSFPGVGRLPIRGTEGAIASGGEGRPPSAQTLDKRIQAYTAFFPQDDLFPGRLHVSWTVAAIAPGVGPTGRGFPLPCLPRRSTDIINPAPQGAGAVMATPGGKPCPRIPRIAAIRSKRWNLINCLNPAPRRYQQEFSTSIGYVSAYGPGPRSTFRK
jgi:hypothetical protein